MRPSRSCSGRTPRCRRSRPRPGSARGGRCNRPLPRSRRAARAVALDDGRPRTLVAAAIGGAARDALVRRPAPHDEDSPAVAVSCANGVSHRGLARGPSHPRWKRRRDPGTITGRGVRRSEKPTRAVRPPRPASRQRHAIELLKPKRAGLLRTHAGRSAGGARSLGATGRFRPSVPPPRATGWDGWVDSEAVRRAPGAPAAPLPRRTTRARQRRREGTSGDEAARDEESARAHGPGGRTLSSFATSSTVARTAASARSSPVRNWLGSEEDRFGAAQRSPIGRRGVFSLSRRPRR